MLGVAVWLALQSLPAARPAELVGYWVEDDRTPGTPDCGSRGTHERVYIELRPHGRMRRHYWPCDGPHWRKPERGHWRAANGRLVLHSDSGLEETFTYQRGERSLELVAADGTHFKMRYEFLSVQADQQRSKLVGQWDEGVDRNGLSDPRHNVRICLARDGHSEDQWYCVAGTGRWRADDEFLTLDDMPLETYRYRVDGRTLTIETSKGERIELHRTSRRCEPDD
jgi:hypothetical protein